MPGKDVRDYFTRPTTVFLHALRFFFLFDHPQNVFLKAKGHSLCIS